MFMQPAQLNSFKWLVLESSHALREMIKVRVGVVERRVLVTV